MLEAQQAATQKKMDAMMKGMGLGADGDQDAKLMAELGIDDLQDPDLADLENMDFDEDLTEE